MTAASQSGKPVVVIARELLDAGTERLAGRCELRSGGLGVDRAELTRLVEGAAGIIADVTVPIDAALLDAAGDQLRVVANFAVGYDNVDLAACRERGVVVCNTPDVLTNATAELALALTSAAARRVGEAERHLRAGRWSGWDPEAHVGLELSDATFGVVGLGRIGRRYAELIRPAAARLLYAGPARKPAAERELDAEHAELDVLLEHSDVVSLHAPGGAATRDLIGAAELERMPAHAVLVNTARGTLINPVALAEALHSGALGAAGLDVYPAEPEVPAVLLDAPRCVLLPHIGSATQTARDAMAELAARNVLAVLDGEEPPARVA